LSIPPCAYLIYPLSIFYLLSPHQSYLPVSMISIMETTTNVTKMRENVVSQGGGSRTSKTYREGVGNNVGHTFALVRQFQPNPKTWLKLNHLISVSRYFPIHILMRIILL
jgi:hypothetical protein